MASGSNEKNKMAGKLTHFRKISKKEAALAHKLITQEGWLVNEVSRLLGRNRTMLRDAIKREIDPNFLGRRGKRSKKSRFLTQEQYEYAKKFYAGGMSNKQKACKILAKKYDWSWHLIYCMLRETSDYDSAMLYAKDFNFTELWNRKQHKWRERHGEVRKNA